MKQCLPHPRRCCVIDSFLPHFSFVLALIISHDSQTFLFLSFFFFFAFSQLPASHVAECLHVSSCRSHSFLFLTQTFLETTIQNNFSRSYSVLTGSYLLHIRFARPCQRLTWMFESSLYRSSLGQFHLLLYCPTTCRRLRSFSWCFVCQINVYEIHQVIAFLRACLYFISE